MSHPVPNAAPVRLAPLEAAHLPVLRGLAPLPEQEAFSGTAISSLSDTRDRVDRHVILQHDQPVGLFKIDRDYEDGRRFGQPGAWGLRGVMIDARHQGRGIGAAAFHQLPGYLRGRYPRLDRLWLTVNLRNQVARRTYLRGGWIDDGTIYHGGAQGPQHVLRLDLRAARAAAQPASLPPAA